MNEKKITIAEFDAAADAVMNEMLNDPDLDGMLKLIFPMIGMRFVSKMKMILFNENKEEK